MRTLLIATVACAARALSASAEAEAAATATVGRSNLVMVLTDDQDELLGSMTGLPQLQRLLGPTSARFTMFVTTPICCPSRSAFLTGSYCHNTKTFQNQMNTGCSNHTTWQLGLEKSQTIGLLLQTGGGYTTGYFGKYLNSYGYPDAGNATVNGTGWVPPGWNRWFGLLGNSQYYGYTVSDDGVAVHHGRDYAVDYFTDLLKNQSAAFLQTALRSRRLGHGGAAFALVATPAAHDPFDPAPQYAGGPTANTSDTAPRTPNWNTGMAGKHFLVSARPPMSAAAADFSDLIHRRRAATLRSVDDLVARLHRVVEAAGELGRTWWVSVTPACARESGRRGTESNWKQQKRTTPKQTSTDISTGMCLTDWPFLF